VLCVAVALVCLVGVAYLAFDRADYGADSTCGNFFDYKGAGGTCAHIMRNRALEAGGLVVIAGSLLASAVVVRTPSHGGSGVRRD